MGSYNETPVELPGRSSKHPDLIEVENHPLRKHVKKGRSFVYLQDVSKAGMKAILAIERCIKIPQGTERDVRYKGWLELKPGDFLFSRSKHGAHKPEDDVLQAWVCGSEIITPEMAERMLAARNMVLGPSDERTRTPAVLRDGHYHGGVAFERNKRAHPVKPNTRCYTLGSSYEAPTTIMAPCAPGKMLGSMDEAQHMRQELLAAVSPIAMAAMRQTVPQIYDILKSHADLVNTPRIGSEDNFAYATAQLNIAPSQKSGGATLKDAMGIFGGPHCDVGDNGGYFSNMYVDSCLPHGYDPGRFFLLYAGVYINLNPATSINFSGLRYHGGSPPTAPEGEEPREDAYRFVVVSYPPNGMTNGNARYALGALPDHSTFYVPREMTDVEDVAKEDRPWSVHANYSGDGHVIQQPTRQIEWVLRSLLCVDNYFISQMPDEYKTRVDPDKFLSAFSFLENGKRRTPDLWEHAPGWRSRYDTNQESPRAAAFAQYTEHYNKLAGHIPKLVVSGKSVSLFQDVEQGGVDAEPSADGQGEQDAGGDRGGRPAGKASVPKPKTPKPKNPKPKNKPKPKTAGKGETKLKDNGKGKRKDLGSVEPVDGDTQNATGKSSGLGRKREDDEALDDDAERSSKRQQLDHSGMSNWDTDTFMNLAKALSGPRDVGQQDQAEGSSSISGYGIINASLSASVAVRDCSDSDEDEDNGEQPNFSFIHNSIDIENLSIELSEVKDAYSNIVKWSAGDEMKSLAMLSEAYSGIRQRPMDARATTTLVHLWQGIRALNRRVAKSTISIRFERSCIMMSTFIAWLWLDGYIADYCEKILADDDTPSDKGDDDSEWLRQLLQDVKNMVDLRKASREFNPRTYSPHLAGKPFIYHNRHHHLIPDSDNTVIVINCCLEVIQTWLEYPSDGSRFRAWFVDAVLKTFGDDALFLNSVWKLFLRVKRWTITKNATKLITIRATEPFVTALKEHPLTDVESPERRIMKDIAKLIEEARTGLSDQPRIEDKPASGSTFDRDKAYLLRIFLREAIDVHYGRVQATSATPLQDAMIHHPDHYYPFREFAPCRLRFRGDDGPFSEQYARSKSGLFSALLFRCVTFDTRFALEEQMVFETIDDWDEAIARHTDEKDDYFCNPTAYGQFNAFRSKDLAADYWEAVHDDEFNWTTFVADGDVTFSECYKWLMGGKPKRFKQLGPLSAYLLTCDYVYAGVVQEPTDEEMGQFISSANKGTMSALRDLSAVVDEKKGISGRKRRGKANETVRGFKEAFALMSEILSDGEKRDVMFDRIAGEHSLCKFARALGKGLI